MTRRLLTMFLLSSLIVVMVTASVSYGADQPIKRFSERASFPARFAPVYGFDGGQGESFASPPKGGDQISLGATANPLMVGETTYDYQKNCSMGHQIEHRGTNFMSISWMRKATDVFGGASRETWYTAYDLSQCIDGEHPFATTEGGSPASGGSRSGYTTIDVDWNNGCAVVAAHELSDPNYYPNTYWDFCTAGPFGLFIGDHPNDNSGDWNVANQYIWPVVDYQIGTATVTHIVTAEFGGAAGDPQGLAYWRRVGGYGTGVGVWGAKVVIDTAMNINAVVASDRNSDKVAVIWNAPADYIRDEGVEIEFANQVENDIWYALSTNQGANWQTLSGVKSIGNSVDQGLGGGFDPLVGGNITTYDSLNDYKAYCDIASLITSDGNLHILWGCRQWSGDSSLFRRQSAIFHWSEDDPTASMVVKTDFDTGGVCQILEWGSGVAKMSLSECDGKLYAIYTQFGSSAYPCDDYGAGSGANFVMNGYVYMSVSDDGGDNWDRGQRVTDYIEPHTICTPGTFGGTGGGVSDGDCVSEYWASSARFGRTATCGENNGIEVLDIMYVKDFAPGGAIQPLSGTWTKNPMMWIEEPCRAVVPEPLYSDDAGAGIGEQFGDPLVVLPNSDTTFTISMENLGLLVNNVTVGFSYTDGDAWMLAAPAGGAIACCGGTLDIDITCTAPGGAPDPSAWAGSIDITHEAIAKTLRSIPVTMVVSSTFSYPESAILATACKRIRVYNTGELVNNASNAALDFIDDCDTFNTNTTSNIYLYDGSPIVARIDGNGDTLVFNMYSKTFTDDDAMRPMSALTVDSSGPDYSYATGEFATADSAIGFIVEYFVPKAADSCDFIIERLKFFNRGTGTLGGVLVGEFLDWDVPSDSGSNNGSGYDATRNLMYQFGGEYNQDDSTEAFCAQESSDRYAGLAMYIGGDAPRNAYSIDNPTYVYTTTSPHLDPPLSYDEMYKLMEPDGVIDLYSSSAPESLWTDLSTLMTFGQYDLAEGNTVCVIKILATTKTGLADLQLAIDKANAFIENHDLGCAVSCDCLPGDANEDGGQNVGDAVYLINFVFKSGPAPLPYGVCSGDANGDCGANVGDAVYLINFVFKSGPEPKTCDFWRDLGGTGGTGCGALQ